ncbi:MAG: hypothetical protein ACRCXA_11065 [Peptostreptococcaceae bacterium]
MYNIINKVNWTVDQLWKGCMLASIAHAIMVAHYPELSYEHSWDGINYNVQDGEGTRGTITFSSKYCVGAFRNDDSDRVDNVNDIKKAKKYFGQAPIEIINIAESDTLQYLLDDIDGKEEPIITTALWGVENKIFSMDSDEDMYHNGLFLLENQLMDFESAIESWVEYYDMSFQQRELLKIIFDLKINQKSEAIVLGKDYIHQIGTDDIEGLEESRISFEEIGIIWN